MVQLKMLSGKKAGAEWSARHFPFTVGRAAGNNVQLDAPGVWDQHFEIAPRGADGFVLTTKPQAFVTINGQATNEVSLKNGDQIEIGTVKLGFAIAPAKQKGSAVRETVTWIALGVLCAAQLFLLYWLLQ